MDEKKKTAEQKAEEHTADSLLKTLVGLTFVRHANLSEEEFLKTIGFEKSGKTEDEAIRIAILNALVATTTEMLDTINTVKSITAVMNTCLNENEKVEAKK